MRRFTMLLAGDQGSPRPGQRQKPCIKFVSPLHKPDSLTCMKNMTVDTKELNNCADEERDSERWGDLSKVTEFGNGKTRNKVWIPAKSLAHSLSSPFTYPVFPSCFLSLCPSVHALLHLAVPNRVHWAASLTRPESPPSTDAPRWLPPSSCQDALLWGPVCPLWLYWDPQMKADCHSSWC